MLYGIHGLEEKVDRGKTLPEHVMSVHHQLPSSMIQTSCQKSKGFC